MHHNSLSINYFLKSWIIFVLFSNSIFAQNMDKPSSVRPWKGFAILGNGNLCAVYSDDLRTKGSGIQGLYYENYTCSYIGSTYTRLFHSEMNTPLKTIKKDSIGMSNFFTSSTHSYYENSMEEKVNCFVHPKNGIVLTIGISGNSTKTTQTTYLLLKKRIITDRETNLLSVKIEKGLVIAEWSNHTFMAIGCKNPIQTFSVKDSIVAVSGKIHPKENIEIVITMDKTSESALINLNRLLALKDISSAAMDYWNAWVNKGDVPKFQHQDEKHYTEYYKRNLYCARAASLGGFVPADITGFFVTNHMPQLYPRDAMMCARVFLLTGHADEAKEIITFWANRKIRMKSKGEWYARYDAYTHAADAGAGARFDEPEWDANGYYIQLLDMYHQKTNIWLTDADFIYELADFLVNNIDSNGLLYEGGIVEWTGYLPATNMTCAAALKTAAKIASGFGDQKRAVAYKQASEKIATSLLKMFDYKNNTYADVRYIGKKGNNNESLSKSNGDTLYLWNTTMNFGVLWGYPNHKEVNLSNAYYQKNTVKNGGGVQYFTSPDPGLAGYGHCMFLFSTAARAQYLSLYGDYSQAKIHIDWMIRNVNSYGLMPERIAVDDSDPTPASPLSWCSAEFATAVLLYGLMR